MNDKFDEFTKSLAQSVTRRAALKKFGVGLAGMALACFGLESPAHAGKACTTDTDCDGHKVCWLGRCYKPCNSNKNCGTGEICIPPGPPGYFGFCGKWV